MKDHDNFHHHAPHDHDVEGDDDSIEATMARFKELFAENRTALDELLELSRDPNRTEELSALIDDLTYDALMNDDEFTTNVRKLRKHQLTSLQEEVIRSRQRELFDMQKASLISEAGLNTEDLLSSIEKSKLDIKKIVTDSIDEHQEHSADKILQVLGILEIGDDGKERFEYPRELFPKITNDKWDTYLETVREHLKIGRGVRLGTISKAELGDADKVRRAAHNSVSRDVHAILGLEELSEEEWPLEKTRNLLAKMRDRRFPTVETTEKFRTGKAIIEGAIGAHAVRALMTPLSDLYKPE